jgi:invasion protein IalB
LVSAALRRVEGQDKQHFMVKVPLAMLIKPGMHVMIYPKDLWERIETNRGMDGSNEAGLQSLTLAYTLCHPAGCTAEVEATPELLASLKSSAGVMMTSTSDSGASVVFSIPLNGFAHALEGEPFDPRKPRTPMRCDQGFWRGCTLP